MFYGYDEVLNNISAVKEAGVTVKTICSHTRGYKWHEKGGVCFKGYIQKGGTSSPLRGENAIDQFCQANCFEDFINILKSIDGVFAVIMTKGNRTWAAVDIGRSMPLYFARDFSIISDDAEEIRLALGIEREQVDYNVLEELLIGYSVGHTRTVYAEIGQLDAGQAVEFQRDSMTSKRYFQHYADTIHPSRTEALKMFQKAADAVFSDMMAAIDNRPVVLSLSGGYDSRYVACMMKRHGVEDVSCYTYGRQDSFEIRQSEAVAKALGYRWTFVEHTDARVKALLDEEALAFIDANVGHDYSTYLQNFIAVRHLHQTGWFKQGSVFITGLCQDMPTGAYALPVNKIEGYRPTSDFLAEYIAHRRNFRILSRAAMESYLAEVSDCIRELDFVIDDDSSFLRAFDAIWTTLEHSRCYLHMNDVHDYFGYEWLLPCWDKRTLAFWYSLPLEYRLQQNLYEEWITQGLPAQYGVGEKKFQLTHGIRGWHRLKYLCNVMINRSIIMSMGIVVHFKSDYNNNAPFMKELYRRIRQKKTVSFRRANIIFLILMFCLERRYGDSFMEKLESIERNKLL